MICYKCKNCAPWHDYKYDDKGHIVAFMYGIQCTAGLTGKEMRDRNDKGSCEKFVKEE